MTTAVKERHEMSVMDESGDTKTTWDEDNEAEVAMARKTFNDMKAKGYVAYRVTKKGDQGEVMTSFDPSAKLMIMAPQMRGG